MPCRDEGRRLAGFAWCIVAKEGPSPRSNPCLDQRRDEVFKLSGSGIGRSEDGVSIVRMRCKVPKF